MASQNIFNELIAFELHLLVRLRNFQILLEISKAA